MAVPGARATVAVVAGGGCGGGGGGGIDIAALTHITVKYNRSINIVAALQDKEHHSLHAVSLPD